MQTYHNYKIVIIIIQPFNSYKKIDMGIYTESDLGIFSILLKVVYKYKLQKYTNYFHWRMMQMTFDQNCLTVFMNGQFQAIVILYSIRFAWLIYH